MVLTLQSLEKFHNLVRAQFEYGGKKYALDESRESTDILFEQYGKNWLFGTMDKYTYRYKNLARERDLLKIATYCYILWLKRGFFFKPTGLVDVLDTTVKVKTEQFPNFLNEVNAYLVSPMGERLGLSRDKMHSVSSKLKTWGKERWEMIDASSVYIVYLLLFLAWQEKYENVESHDEDINNEAQTEQTKV